MVVDAVRTYLDAANGLTELSRKQAVAAAKTLLRANGSAASASVAADGDGPPPRVGQSIQTLAGELIETSQANRAAVAELVRDEVRRALEQLDVVPRAEFDRMTRRVAELERRMAARHAVERVLTPRGGASSALPNRGETVRDTARENEETAEPARASRGRTVRARGKAAVRAEADAAEVPTDTSAEELEDEQAAVEDGEETPDALNEDEDAGTAEDTAEDTERDADDEESSPAPAGDEDDGDDTEAGSGTKPDTAKRTASRGKTKTAAKSTAKTPAKSTRTRSTAKRTPKGKGAKK